jgi:hypothetical protein
MQSEVLTSEEALTGAMNEFVILHKTACTAASKAASTSHCGAAAPHIHRTPPAKRIATTAACYPAAKEFLIRSRKAFASSGSRVCLLRERHFDLRRSTVAYVNRNAAVVFCHFSVVIPALY